MTAAEQLRKYHRDYKRKQRENPKHRNEERKKNRDIIREYRKDPKYRELEKLRNAENHKKRMQCPEYKKMHNLKGQIRNFPSLKVEDVLRMYEEQQGKCAICENPTPLHGSADTAMNIDHCHKSGQPRGLLCHKCNTKVMALIDNDLDLILKGLVYKRKASQITVK